MTRDNYTEPDKILTNQFFSLVLAGVSVSMTTVSDVQDNLSLINGSVMGKCHDESNSFTKILLRLCPNNQESF